MVSQKVAQGHTNCPYPTSIRTLLQFTLQLAVFEFLTNSLFQVRAFSFLLSQNFQVIEKPQDKPPCKITKANWQSLKQSTPATRSSGTPKSHYFNGKKWPEGPSVKKLSKEFQYMKPIIHAFYVAIVIHNSQHCYNGIQVTIISITGLTCLFHVGHCPRVF